MEFIDKLDSSLTIGDDDYRDFITITIEEKLKNANSGLQAEGTEFLKTIGYLLELVHHIRTLPEGEEYDDERTLGLTRLMEIISKANRQDTYVRYVHQLAQVHSKSKNFTEAAFALALHADLIPFGDNILPAELHFPRQTASARKEQLLNQIVELLASNKFWESALVKSKQMVEHCEKTSYDFKKVCVLDHFFFFFLPPQLFFFLVGLDLE